MRTHNKGACHSNDYPKESTNYSAQTLFLRYLKTYVTIALSIAKELDFLQKCKMHYKSQLDNLVNLVPLYRRYQYIACAKRYFTPNLSKSQNHVH